VARNDNTKTKAQGTEFQMKRWTTIGRIDTSNATTQQATPKQHQHQHTNTKEKRSYNTNTKAQQTESQTERQITIGRIDKQSSNPISKQQKMQNKHTHLTSTVGKHAYIP
jgi:hypothetical protein